MALAEILKKLTKQTKPRTAADLKADLAQLDLVQLEDQVNALEAERRRLLLAGDDADVAAIGEKIIAANLACERGAAARDELTKRIAEAEAAEAEAAVESAVAEADTVRMKLADATTELDRTVTKAAGLLSEVAGHGDRLRALNKGIEKAGRPVGKVTDVTVIKRRIIDRFR